MGFRINFAKNSFSVDAISIDSTMFQKDQKEAGYISESCEIAKAFEMVKGRSIKDRDCDFDETFGEKYDLGKEFHESLYQIPVDKKIGLC